MKSLDVYKLYIQQELSSTEVNSRSHDKFSRVMN